MHIIVGIRGDKGRVDDFVNDCRAQFYPYRYKDDKGKWFETHNVKLAMRPIYLYDIVFPEPQLMTVLANLRPDTTDGYQETPVSQIVATMIRKTLKLTPFPSDEDIKKARKTYLMDKHDIDIVGIGIKKDIYKDEVEQL